MSQTYEYTFVRLDKHTSKDYQQTVAKYARDGWRLVQIYAPGAGGLWASPQYVEVIFERVVAT